MLGLTEVCFEGVAALPPQTGLFGMNWVPRAISASMGAIEHVQPTRVCVAQLGSDSLDVLEALSNAIGLSSSRIECETKTFDQVQTEDLIQNNDLVVPIIGSNLGEHSYDVDQPKADWGQTVTKIHFSSSFYFS